MGALYLCLSSFFFLLLLSLTILPPLVALSLTPHLHLRLFIGTHPSIFSSLTSLPAPPFLSWSVLSYLIFIHSAFYSLFTFISSPVFCLYTFFLYLLIFSLFCTFFFPRFGKRWQPWPKHTRALVNSSYDMQMRVKILTVYLTHIITQLNARAGATAAVWACACLPVNCVPAHSVLMKKKQPHLLLSSWIWEKRKQ